MTPARRPDWQTAILTLSSVVTATIIFWVLYVGRVVLIPIALAIFFTYVLAPVVSFLQKRHVPRAIAVIITVAGSVAFFVLGSYIVTRELGSLSQTIANNSEQIKVKIDSIKAKLSGQGDARINKLLEDLDKKLLTSEPSGDAIVVETRKSSWSVDPEKIVNPVAENLALAGFSFVLVIFMLLAKTDLADRVLRLIGDGQVTTTTRAMADASKRISKYLFRQLLINVTFGVFIATALYCIGLEYSLLWGAIITVMRYVPYIGTWIGVIPPTIFAFAISPDWYLPLATFGIIVGCELIVNNFVEPKIYGASLGVSEVAQLISAAIWSFLWGPVGLILSGPITTCLLVLGRHSPRFRFLEILLGDQPPLTPGLALYQRLASRDQDEALRTLRSAMRKDDPARVFDEAFVPAVIQVKTAQAEGIIDLDHDKQLVRISEEILDEIIEEQRKEPLTVSDGVQRIRLLACPSQDDYDRLSIEMLVAQLPSTRWDVRVTAVSTLTSEVLADAIDFDPQVIVIASLPPGGRAHARYLCKRLRARFPDDHILVGRWGSTGEDNALWEQAGANAVDTEILEGVRHLNLWEPVFQAEHNSDVVRVLDPEPVVAGI